MVLVLSERLLLVLGDEEDNIGLTGRRESAATNRVPVLVAPQGSEFWALVRLAEFDRIE